MYKSTIVTVALLLLVAIAHADISLPFTPNSELRVKFTKITTDTKLNIFENVYTSLKCAPTVNVVYTPKENSYISYYVMEWNLGSANVLHKKVEVGQYLYTKQNYQISEQFTTFNCKYGGHTELNFKPGKYTFTFTLYDNNKRTEVIGKVSFSDQLNCTAMDDGCWAYTACDYYSTDCSGPRSLEVEGGDEEKQ